MTLEIGDSIPDIVLLQPDGESLALRRLGAPLVVYFYPKDDTPGCTKEAQTFSAFYADFHKAGAQVLGISKDTPAKHQKFIAKYDLTVSLASDVDDAATGAFGTWVEKSLYGKKYMGIDRATFLFGANGKLAQVWRKVKVPGHAEAVLAAVQALPA